VSSATESSEKGAGGAALAISLGDDRPSADPFLAGGNDPLANPLSKEEAALAPTDPTESKSRIGAVAADALAMPLPAMRITMPSVPVYAGPAAPPPAPMTHAPPPKEPFFTGPRAALSVFVIFLLLGIGAVALFFLLPR
jgi:hypothetical protein